MGNFSQLTKDKGKKVWWNVIAYSDLLLLLPRFYIITDQITTNSGIQ